MFINKLKFKSRLLVPIIISIIIFVAVIQYLVYSASSKIVLGKAKEEISAKTTEITKLINLQLKSNMNYLEALAASPYITNIFKPKFSDSDKKATQVFIDDIMKSHPQFGVAIVTDAKGKIIFSDQKEYVGVDISSREYLQKALLGNTTISKVVFNKVTGKPVYTICTPVKIDNQIVGTFLIAENISSIDDKYIKPVKIGKTGYAFVFDKDSLILIHPNSEIVMNEDFARDDQITRTAIKVSPEPFRYWWEKTSEYKQLVANPTDNGWYIAITVPEQELLEVLTPIKYISVIGGLVLIVIISIIVLLVLSPVAKILISISKKIHSLSQGDIREIPEHTDILKNRH